VVIVIVALVAFWPAQYGGITGLTVVDGESMEPTYVTGDLVVSIRQPSYSVGDIISYTVPSGQDGAGGRVIHRLNSIDSSDGVTIYTTLGDNNFDQVDPWIIGPQDVMGKALFVIPAVGNIIGGMSNPLLIGLISGVLVTVILWSSDSKEEKRLKKAQKAERERGGAL
jgi:signal peptidase